MIKTLSKSIREFKKPAILTPILVVGEVILECIIPFVIANLVNEMQAGCGMDVIIQYGLQLVIMAVLSLILGVAAGNTCATASTGFSRNLRQDMFYHIQDYSFENIDKFSVSSLVTRMTTDVINVQMSFMMIIRVAIRGPLMLIFSFIMGFAMGGRLAMIFLVTIPLLGIALVLVIRKATPIFRRVFRKYDALNDSVQENVQAMRVVKSYVREDYEKKKFGAAAEDVCKDFTRAERIMAINNPMMQFCVYAGMVFVLSFGSYAVISSQGLEVNVGQMSAIITYSFQILMSLMMLSMVFVMITMSMESAERIVEVLQEQSTLTSPEKAVKEVKDAPSILTASATSTPEPQSATPGACGSPHPFRRAHRHSGRHRLVQDHPGAADPPALRRDGGRSAGRRCRRAELRPGNSPRQRGHGAAEERAVLRHHQG